MVGCRSVQVGPIKWACSPSRSCSGPWVVRQSVGVVSFGLPPWPGSLVATPLFGSSRSPCSWWQRCRSASSTTSTKRSTADPGRSVVSASPKRGRSTGGCSARLLPDTHHRARGRDFSSRATPLLAGLVVLAHGAAGSRCGGKSRAGTCPRRPLRRGTAVAQPGVAARVAAACRSVASSARSGPVRARSYTGAHCASVSSSARALSSWWPPPSPHGCGQA